MQHLGQVGCGPLAVHIGLGKADVAACEGEFHEIVVVDDDFGRGAAFGIPVNDLAVIGQGELKGSPLGAQQGERGKAERGGDALEAPDGLCGSEDGITHAASFLIWGALSAGATARVAACSGGVGRERYFAPRSQILRACQWMPSVTPSVEKGR